MAAPAYTNGTPYTGASASSHTINLPAGTAFKGVWIATLSDTAHTVSGPAGWSVVQSLAITSARRFTLLTSDAATSATSVQVDTTQATIAAAQGFSTDGALDDLIDTTWTNGSSNVPDPPALSGMASGDYRVVAACCYFDARRSVSGYPTNYADNQSNPTHDANNEAGVGHATRALTSITAEDPGTFTLSGNIIWGAATIAIPAGAPPSVTGTIAVTEAADTMTASGSIDGGITGTVAVTEASDTLDMAGTVTGPPLPGDLPTAAVIAIYDARLLAGDPTDPVSSWPDTGPHGEDPLVQGTGGNQPTIDDTGFGSVRSVLFDGVNDHLDMALASTYTDDFALIMVGELVTYPTGTAAVFYSTGSVPNKNILGVDDAEDPPGWVVMSGEDGTQAQHHHGTADQGYLEDVPSRFIMTQLVRNDGELKLWENASLVIDLEDASGEGSPLNNLAGLKLGGREDNSRFVNGRIAYMLLVDMGETDEATLLDARDEIAVLFNVPGFASSNTGTIAVTEANDASTASGTVAPPAFTGTIAVTEANDTMTASGTITSPAITGTIAVTEANDTSTASGSISVPEFTGTINVDEANDTSAITGTNVTAYTGTIAGTEANDIMTAIGGGLALDITAFDLIQFHRNGDQLVYSPIGRGTRRGFAASEGFERVSDVVRVDNQTGADGSANRAMLAVAGAWAAHSGDSAAVLKSAIHAALQLAGFRRHDGTDLT